LLKNAFLKKIVFILRLTSLNGEDGEEIKDEDAKKGDGEGKGEGYVCE
jgi:hypothetical protein